MALIRRRSYGFEINPGGAQEHMVSENFNTIAAGTGVEIPFFRAHGNLYLFSAWFTNQITLALNAGNFTTLTLTDRDASGTLVGAITPAGFSNQAAGFTAFSPIQFTDAPVGYQLASGHVLSLKKTETGTGSAITQPCVTIVFK